MQIEEKLSEPERQKGRNITLVLPLPTATVPTAARNTPTQYNEEKIHNELWLSTRTVALRWCRTSLLACYKA